MNSEGGVAPAAQVDPGRSTDPHLRETLKRRRRRDRRDTTLGVLVATGLGVFVSWLAMSLLSG